jgi:hypothetical protein
MVPLGLLNWRSHARHRASLSSIFRVGSDADSEGVYRHRLAGISANLLELRSRAI